MGARAECGLGSVPQMGPDPGGASRRPTWPTVLLDVVVALALGVVVIALNRPVLDAQGFGTVWFGAVAVGVLYLVPLRRWWAYVAVLVVLQVYVTLTSPHSVADATIRNGVTFALTLLAAFYLKRTTEFPLRRLSDAWRLVGVSLVVGAVRMILGGGAHLLLNDAKGELDVSPLSYGLNAFVGLLLFVPVVVLLGQRGSWPTWRKPDRFGQSLLLVAALSALVGGIFVQSAGSVVVGWALVTIPIVLLLAAVYPQLALALGLIVVGLGTSYATTLGYGPFAPTTTTPEALSRAALNVELFLSAVPASAWVLAAAMRQQHDASENARRAAARLADAILSAPNPMAVWRGSGTLETVNDAFMVFFNLSEQEVGERTWTDLAWGSEEPALAHAEKRRFELSDGSTRWGLLSVASMTPEGREESLYIVQIVDVTGEEEARQAADAATAQARRLLDYDAVTGLHSRSWITDALDRALARNLTTPSRVAVMFIDLSAFQDVASDLSFESSDVLFRDLAAAIAEELNDPWILGRFETTHVVAVNAEIPSRDALVTAADTVLARLEQDIALHEMRISRSASVGMAMGAEGSTAQSLLRDANHALLVAKARGRSRSFLASADIGMSPRHQLGLEQEIREGLDLRQFVLHFQPQVDLATGAVVAYEALARWQHPERGLLGPGEFIHTAEKTGLIVPLGSHLVEMACLAVRNNPDLPGPISVNVSAVELAHTGWAERFLQTLERYDVRMDQLSVEVTETSVLELTEEASDDLRRLRDCGMNISVDDFGTGYAAVRMLQQLPVTELKLDRTFVAQLADPDTSGLGLIRGIANLAGGMGLHVVAEGIETVDEARIVRDVGYPVGQGFLFARPSAELVRSVPFPLND